MDKLKEEKTIEFKQEFTSSFLKTVSAFANYGDGEIIFGISDDGEVVGIKNIDQLRLAIENAINDTIEPRPSYTLIETTMEKKAVLILNVYKGESQPYFYKGKAYRRMDTASVPVDRTALQKLVLIGSRIDFDEMPSKNKELRFEILFKWLKSVLGIEVLTNDVLISLGLLEHGVFNNAAELLSDNNKIKSSCVDMVRFGDNISIFLDRKTIQGGSILLQYEEAIEFFRQWYKPYLAIEGIPRKERIQIPELAFLEAMANALIHRDYLINGSIRIEMYKDQLIIHSQGGLPDGVSKDDYLNKNISIPRNSILADVFHRLKLIERFGTGVRRIRQAYSEFKEKPLFDFSEQSISVILPCVTYGDNLNLDIEGAHISDDEKVMKLIRSEKLITRKTVQEITGLGETQSKALLNRLIDSGFIRRVGKGRMTAYEHIES
ncbi:RNA-binding domain-containing protein [Acetobacterium sp. UBA5834]|jgi:ATP-dependent DNA helicase RecG|uniref:RNA-binding domain-containing protein n=1 Tax=Acetobacterium sp. UBA5834 TaxID=1945907 RepID=UPI00257C6CA4|nr:RNA-binding domain-containing protein [Acetobacterium sp. UBA5834]